METQPSEEYTELTKPASGNGDGHTLDLPHDGAEHSHVPVHHPRQTRIRVAVFAVIAVLGLTATFFWVRHSHNATMATLDGATAQLKDQPVPVDVMRVQRAGRQKILTLPGDARSFYETTIFARTSGYVSDWKVDIGDLVTKDQVLALIETPELDDQLNEANARFRQLQAQANVAATSEAFAKISFDRWELAAPEGAVSAQERDQKKSELDSAVAKRKAADSEVDLGKAQVQRLETLERFKEVRAPFDGVITRRFVEIGALVTAGSTTNTTPLYTISQSNTIRVFVDVPQPAVPDIQHGMQAALDLFRSANGEHAHPRLEDNMQATVTSRELPGQKFTGYLDRTAKALDMQSRTLKVEVLVPNPKLTLLPGMYVQVRFESNRADTPLLIPAAALSFGPVGSEVAVVGSDGRLTFRPITISRDLGESVEVGSGLEDDEMVALNVGSQVVSGERVDAHVVEAAPHATTERAKHVAGASTQPAVAGISDR